jgi:hypothetical protein
MSVVRAFAAVSWACITAASAQTAVGAVHRPVEKDQYGVLSVVNPLALRLHTKRERKSRLFQAWHRLSVAPPPRSLSKLEKQSDMQISTLRKIVKALGGELEVLAKFPREPVKIDQFDPSHARPGHRIPHELQLS